MHEGIEDLGELVYAMRKLARMSQGDIERATGIKQTNISAYELGKVPPTLSSVHRIAKATGHSIVLQIIKEEEKGERSGISDRTEGSIQCEGCRVEGRKGVFASAVVVDVRYPECTERSNAVSRVRGSSDQRSERVKCTGHSRA